MSMMSVALASLALISAVWALRSVRKISREIEFLKGQIQYRKEQTDSVNRRLEELKDSIGRYLEELSGGRVSRLQFVEGRLFQEVEPDQAFHLYQQRDTVLLDVREPHEVKQVRIPGSVHIPFQELEERVDEIPGSARTILVHCAVGSRSHAACEILSEHHGFLNLFNVVGGIQQWPGETERGEVRQQESPSGTAT